MFAAGVIIKFDPDIEQVATAFELVVQLNVPSPVLVIVDVPLVSYVSVPAVGLNDTFPAALFITIVMVADFSIDITLSVAFTTMLYVPAGTLFENDIVLAELLIVVVPVVGVPPVIV